MSDRAQAIRDLIEQCADEDTIQADGLEDALIGVAERCSQGPTLVYDRDAAVRILVDRDGMTEEEAEDYFSFNVIGAWVGERTPLFVTLLPKS